MKAFSLFILVLCLNACATIPDFNAMKEDINALQSDSAQSKKEIAALKEKNASQSREIDVLKEKSAGAAKEDSFAALRDNQAEINSRLSEVSGGLQDLRGRFEENKYNTEKTVKESAGERDLLKAQISALESQLKNLKDRLAIIEEANKAKGQSKKPEDLAEAEKPSEDSSQKHEAAPHPEAAQKSHVNLEKKTYDAAYQAFKNKHFKEAREKFEAFLKDFPGSDHADNAQFWIGESYYGEKDYEGAILAYETLLKKYPKSSKVSGALLKQGLAFLEIGDSKTGKTILKRVVEKFPDSQEAALAKKKLAEAGKKPGRKK